MKKKKPVYKRWWFIVLVIIIIAAAFAGPEEEVVESDKDNSDIVNTSESIETPEVNDKEESSNDIVAELYYQVLLDNFEGIAEIELDKEEKRYIFLPIEDGFAGDVVGVIDGEEEAVAGWSMIVENFKEMSSTLSEEIEGYQIILLNPVNTENFLLMIEDGNVIYDFAND